MTYLPRARARAVRSDGARTRAEILRTAARLASVRGLHHVSIGELADEIGMSKSGLYAHFGSKEELQLAAIEAAEAIYAREVTARTDGVAPGLGALIAFLDAHLDHLRRRVFPGGCFFDAAAADLQGTQGPVRERIAVFQARWTERLREHLRTAQAMGALPSDEDVDQVAFDLTASMLLAHSLLSFTGDEAALDRAARSVRLRLGVG